MRAADSNVPGYRVARPMRLAMGVGTVANVSN